MAQVQKKTSTMSLTISSSSRELSSSSSSIIVGQQRQSSPMQPLCINSQTVPKVQKGHAPCSRNGGFAPTFIKSLHDVSTVKGQLVVLECRVMGTPPLNVSWYREDNQIPDSADFRILRKKSSSTAVPEELCTLVITEAYPEDSGIFKCVTKNQFGTASCSALLEVYTDLDEVLTDATEESTQQEKDIFPSLFKDVAHIPPPQCPDTLEEETDQDLSMMPEVQPAIKTAENSDTMKNNSNTASQISTKATDVSCTSTSLLKGPSGTSKSVADVPVFSPMLCPPCAFNYERPRHFIQSQPAFQTPNYDILQSSEGSKSSYCFTNLITPTAIPASSVSLSQHVSSQGFTGMTLIARESSSQCKATTSTLESTLQPDYISMSQLPSQSPRHSPTSQSSLPNTSQEAVLPPNLPQLYQRPVNATSPPQHSPLVPKSFNYTNTPKNLPKPILKKTVSQAVLHTTDAEIQGSKDALIQDLEKKLHSKKACKRNIQRGSQGGQQTGVMCGKLFPEGNETEDSAIQEKCYAPRFIQIPQDLSVEEGRFCRIDFKVGGLPTPDITWYLDGKAIKPDDYHKMLVCEKGLHSFIIEIVTVHHAGVYECVARNRAGESRFSLQLDVVAQELHRPPAFVVKMQSVRVLEGDAVRLECKVAGSPTPQIYWKKDKEMLRINPSRMSLSQDCSGWQCLLIDRAEKSDAGWYTLSAINEAGMSTCNARLDVATQMNKTDTTVKSIKTLPVINQFSSMGLDSSSHYTAPLYESEEL